MEIKDKLKNQKQKITESQYMNDPELRTRVSLYISLVMNLLYVGINLLSFVLYRSMWFIVLAVYYVLLSAMRFVLLRYITGNGLCKSIRDEYKAVRICASLLLTVNFALSGAVLMILYQDKGFEYHGYLIYAVAAYTFYITAHTVRGLIKYKSFGSPVMTMTKIISLSAAMVSMLSLETAMLSQFGQDMSDLHKWLFVALTGAGVSILVVTMSVYMLVISSKEIKRSKGADNGK